MVRKQWFVLILIGLFALALGACAKKPATKVETQPAPEVAEQPAAPAEEVTETPQVQEEVPAVKIPVLSDVFFDFDKSTISDEGKQALAENARQLKEGGAMGIVIEGHCDERGTNAYNLALGEKRANAAKDYLVSLGVDGARIQTISYGEERPFDPGHDETAWAKNRRAHFVINQ